MNCLLTSGGAGLGAIEDCIMMEELSYGCSGISNAIEANTLGVRGLFRILAPKNPESGHFLVIRPSLAPVIFPAGFARCTTFS